MIRTQIQLTDEQVRMLRRVAAQRGLSMAAVIRELIEQGLTTASSGRSARARAAIGRFASGGSSGSREHDGELERAFAD